jgi:transcription-repair coupling factor (superfamily II helicase)
MEASFRYEDTPDQASTVDAVKQDMEQPVPMDRLVCGDVGFGKDGNRHQSGLQGRSGRKQVAVLVPTTILADQHFRTFKDRLSSYPVRVEAISRFRSAAQQKTIVRPARKGDVDILIGTHRIVSKDVRFKDLGLLIIDEEQRFGVAAKERLRQLRSEVDTLTLTATPIPRTLQFSLLGARDLSIITTPPPNRQPIVTEIHGFNKDLIRDAILYELSRDGQVFFIHNRVQSIEEVASSLRAMLPDVRMRTAHGQMKGSDLEKVMADFINHKFDVLISTNIIENGLDIANANTIIVNHADRFGLSELHQLRGRVGRSDRKAFCYLLVRSVTGLTREARMRLEALEEFSELGGGFNIAMRDLDIRGAGNMLGGEQSGFIEEVGFETYHQILDEAVLEFVRRNSAMSSTPHAPRAGGDSRGCRSRYVHP